MEAGKMLANSLAYCWPALLLSVLIVIISRLSGESLKRAKSEQRKRQQSQEEEEEEEGEGEEDIEEEEAKDEDEVIKVALSSRNSSANKFLKRQLLVGSLLIGFACILQASSNDDRLLEDVNDDSSYLLEDERLGNRSIGQVERLNKVIEPQLGLSCGRAMELAGSNANGRLETGKRRIELAKLATFLGQYYELPKSSISGQLEKADKEKAKEKSLAELPRPTNVTVLIMSWSPPILKLSWNLNELDTTPDTERLDFYAAHPTSSGPNGSNQVQVSGKERQLLDLDLLALDSSKLGAGETDKRNKSANLDQLDEDGELIGQLGRRRALVRQSLTCFQVTYNIVNSRFKVTEEYPPYLRSVLMEKLLPATEYSLNVVAVYLNQFGLFSERVQFVSPTDNESRRFKENTYRPIHRYPDEQRELKIGLAQVRSEELTIVAIALIFWIATICLFFNKWGKIRMLEPYQPAYREQSATFAPASPQPAVGQLHHPSLHNLPNLSTPVTIGSAGSESASPGLEAGIQSALSAKLATLCASPANSPNFIGLGLLARHSPESGPIGQAFPISGEVAQVVQGAVASEQLNPATGPRVSLIGLAENRVRNSEGALTCRKASRSLLVLGNKRFETVADDSPINRRTGDAFEHPINYNLFQAKAQALAKATKLWSRHKQQQLREQQLRSRLLLESGVGAALQPGSGPPAGLATLRGLSRGLSSGSPVPPPSGDSPPVAGPPLARRSSAKGRPPFLPQFYPRGQRIPPLDWPGGAGRGGRLPASRPFAVRSLDRQSSQQEQAAQLADGDQERPPVWPAPSASPSPLTSAALIAAGPNSGPLANLVAGAKPANKLRRLLYMNKSHHHHHIATSTSSTTLISGSQPQANQRAGQAGAGDTPKLNSVSLDNDAEGSCQHRKLTDNQSIHGGSWRRETRDHLTSSLPANIALNLDAADSFWCPDSAAINLIKRRAPSAALAAVNYSPPKTVVTRAGSPLNLSPGSSSAALIEHHILIEPPSPPSSSSRCAGDETPAGQEASGQLAGSQPADLAGGGGQSAPARSAGSPANNQAEAGLAEELINLADQQAGPLACREPSCASRGGQEESAFSKLARYQAHLSSLRQQRPTAPDWLLCRPCEAQFGQFARPPQAEQQQQHHQSFCTCSEAGYTGQQQQQRARSVSGTCTPGRPAASLRRSSPAGSSDEQQQQQVIHYSHDDESSSVVAEKRPRMSSVFVASPYSGQHRDSFAMLRALSQKKSKSAEDIAYLSSLVLQIWVRDRNPLLQSASQQQLSLENRRQSGLSRERQQQQQQQQQSQSQQPQRPKSSLTVAHI